MSVDESLVTCPKCRGAKTFEGIACGANGCKMIVSACDFCNGAGAVSPARAQAWERGQRMRDERVRQGLTLHEKAALLGMEPEALNGLEHGEEPAPAR